MIEKNMSKIQDVYHPDKDLKLDFAKKDKQAREYEERC